MLRLRMLGRVLACAAIAAAVGCGESHVSGDEDAAIVIDLDGAMLDGGPPDGGPVEDFVGASCASDTSCGTDGVCLNDPGFLPGGYCSLACTGDEDCGPNGACLMLGGGQAYCFRTCDPTATERECRMGYGCGSLGFGSPPVCVGGCTDDTDCADGLRCDPAGGFAAGGCYSPDSSVGDACTTPEDCPMSGFCLDEPANGWPNGSCVTFGTCDVGTNTGCPDGAHCIPNGDEGLCIDACTTAADCRPGYDCRAPAGLPERMYCTPGCTTDAHCSGGNVCNPGLGTCAVPFDPDLLGGTCSRFRGGCEGGTCFSEGQTGFPGSYCAYQGCTVGDDTTCPAGGACTPSADGRNVCLDGCATDGDCRAGYACRHVVPTDDTSSMACMPACTTTEQCVNADRFGTVCHLGTGLCDAPFVEANQGEPCASGEDCAGGRCLSEADGWPAGTCAAVGCSLMSGVAGDPCPADSTCVDDGGGRPEIGYCLDTCTVGAATGCRTGYTCTAIVDGGTEGVCRPTPAPPAP